MCGCSAAQVPQISSQGKSVFALSLLRFSIFLLSLIPLLLMAGCPTGGGEGATISGMVVDATNITQGIANANLYVYVPAARDTRQADQEPAASTVSGTDGSYDLTGVPTGDLQLVVTLPQGSTYAGVQLDITVSATASIQLDIKLLAAALANQVAAVAVSPSSATVAPGGTQSFTATVINRDGTELADVSATWTVIGNIGSIDSNGQFTAGHQTGSGFVVATAAGGVGFAAVSVAPEQPTGQAVITVRLSANPESGTAPLEVVFSGAATTTRPDIPITQYVLDFGDGTPEWTSTSPPSNLVHTYSVEGGAILRVTDRDGNTDTDRVFIAMSRSIPQGSLIAFLSVSGSDIYVMNTDGTGQTNITVDLNGNGDPAWSPDGTKIAFTRDMSGMGLWWEIYVMSADGTMTDLTNSPESDWGPAWSPDGAKIAFVRGSFPGDPSGGHIYVMNADGTGQTMLTSPDWPYEGDGSPAWSPDGTKIAFERGGPDSGIWVMNADGTGQTRLENAPPGTQSAWSPNGTKIAFVAAGIDWFDIYVINADGTGLTNLTNTPDVEDYAPAWSPDGTKIAFASGVVEWWDHSICRTLPYEIYVMNADGSGQTNLTNTADLSETDPAWRPVP